VAAVTGRVPGCTASTVVPLREPGVDWMRDGLRHEYTRQIKQLTALINENKKFH